MQTITNSLDFFVNDYTRRKHLRDEATHHKIQKHLCDVNDLITEDDIRNIKILLLGKHIDVTKATLDKIILERQ